MCIGGVDSRKRIFNKVNTPNHRDEHEATERTTFLNHCSNWRDAAGRRRFRGHRRRRRRDSPNLNDWSESEISVHNLIKGALMLIYNQHDQIGRFFGLWATF